MLFPSLCGHGIILFCVLYPECLVTYDADVKDEGQADESEGQTMVGTRSTVRAGGIGRQREWL